MCGICGIYRSDGGPIDRSVLARMISIMAHRGPDGIGSYLDRGIGLGHRRLSIIDIEGGAQPLSNEDYSLQIVFNGEIYNYVELKRELEKSGHTFKTHSDTEVIIHAYEEWGVGCLNRFNGIFAFAIWDASAKKLFLARDHLGVKPLYYLQSGGKLLFASEIKSILQDDRSPREVDLKSLGELFTFRYVPSPNTIFKGIKKLPPAHWMLCSAGQFKIEKYWPWVPVIDQGRKESDLIEEYRELLQDVVKLQLRSDVPVGLFLSSGVYSSALLAMMRKNVSGRIHTFTIGFKDGQKTNETDDARNIARIFDTEHDEMIVGPEDYEKYFDRLLWDLEEPIGHEPAGAFYFVSKIASEKVKVVLTGQGADEPWAGYRRYIGVKLSKTYSRLPLPVTNSFKKFVLTFLKHEGLRRGVCSLNEPDILTRFAMMYSFFSPDMKERLFQDWVKEAMSPGIDESKEALRRLQSEVSGLDPLAQMLYIDTRASLPDDLLTVNDKTSMTNSLEARVPYLDHRLIEFVERIPSHFKLRGFSGKYIHKKAIEKWLPRAVVYRKKKGFDNPIEFWFRGKMNGYLVDCLLGSGSAAGQYFDRTYLGDLIRLHGQGSRLYLRHIYLLLCFELWHRQFIQSRPNLECGALMPPLRQTQQRADEFQMVV